MGFHTASWLEAARMQPAGDKGQERTLGLCSFSLCQDGEETLGWWVEEGWELAAPCPTANTHRREVLKHPHGAWINNNTELKATREMRPRQES